ncbi:hypothetical protein BC941DRAFT_242001 [Chlamydoabsidia padenii]|nr:hypothetical protein BC941DRAFT_242001 [Chlamydoabsidia padenii]
MPTEARFAGPQAAENAGIPTSSTAGLQSTSSATTSIPENPTSASTLSNTPSTGNTGQAQYPEEYITTLTNLGMSRQEALNALEMSGGNIDLAASLLF